MAVVLLLCLIASSVTHAFALTSTEKEEMYSAAVLELESYLENAGNSSEELVGILAAFDTLSGYEQSRFLGYYVRVLQKIADENYDQMMLLYLDMLNNPMFEQYIKDNLKNSSIRPVSELKLYAQAREYEHNGQTELALDTYKECLSFSDAADRYYTLQSRGYQQTYEGAQALLLKEDYAGAYFMFKSISKYEDSEIYMNSIVNLMGYTPASATDNLMPVKNLKVKSANNNSIMVQWSSSKHASSYEVYYQSEKTNNWVLAEKTTSTSSTIINLNQGEKYSIKVIACSASIHSEEVTISSMTSVPTPTPSPTPKPTPTPTPLTDIYGFGYTIETFEIGASKLYESAKAWTSKDVPKSLDDFPIVPANLLAIVDKVSKMPTSFTKSNEVITWKFDAEKAYEGNWGIITYDKVYGYYKTGNTLGEVAFTKTGNNEYQATVGKNEDVYYVRHDRRWSYGDWECNANFDFVDAKNKNGGCIVFIGMYNSKTRMDIHWQINTSNRNSLNIHVYLNNDNKYFSIDYNVKTKQLTNVH